jgi:cytochrome c-type biogenesis protein CcmH
MKFYIFIFTLLFFLHGAQAAVEVKEFESQQQEQRYKNLINELRCLVCQNQNLAGSNAGLAQDLRKQVYKMVREGQSDDVILDFMVTRYGDFVLYRPPFKAITVLLWLGPFIILAAGLLVLIRFIRQRKKIVIKNLTAQEKEKLKQLLAENKEQTK